MAVNLKALNPAQLEALIKDANAQLEGARQNQIQTVKTKIDALLKVAGLTLVEVYPGHEAKKPKHGKGIRVVAPKFRNPNDHSQTWTGRGRQPSWFAEAIKKRGVTLDSLLIGDSKTNTAKKAPKKVAKKAVKKVAKKAVKKSATRT